MSQAAVRLAARGVAVAGTASGIFVAYKISDDPGFRRSSYFWVRVMPMYWHYRFVEWRVKHLPNEAQYEAYEPLHDAYAPIALDVIKQLKGFYVKIGQVASTRSDFLPPQYLDRLSTMQDDVPCEDFVTIKDIFLRSTGMSIEEVFSWIDEKPLGAASIGQAHRAILKNGREVVVKIMYPDVESMFKGDMQTIKQFCAMAQPEHLPALNEIEKQFLTEFDYRREAWNLQLVRDNIMPVWYRKVVVPGPIMASKNVLIMEYVPGLKLVDALKKHLSNVAKLRGMTLEDFMDEIAQKQLRGEKVEGATSAEIFKYSLLINSKDFAQNFQTFLTNCASRVRGVVAPLKKYVRSDALLDTQDIINTLFEVHGYQIFVNGSFNGDPHPGNILLTPEGRLGLIDYGQVKHLTQSQRRKLARLIVALHLNNKAEVVQAYTDLGFRTKRMDPDVLFAHANLFFNIDDPETLGGTNVQTFLEKLQEIDPMVAMADDFIMAGRVAVLLRGLGYALKYRIRCADVWSPMAIRALTTDSDTESIPEATEPLEQIVYFDKPLPAPANWLGLGLGAGLRGLLRLV